MTDSQKPYVDFQVHFKIKRSKYGYAVYLFDKDGQGYINERGTYYAYPVRNPDTKRVKHFESPAVALKMMEVIMSNFDADAIEHASDTKQITI